MQGAGLVYSRSEKEQVMSEAYHILYKPTEGNAFGRGVPIKSSFSVKAVSDSEAREAAQWQNSDHIYRTMFRFKPHTDGHYTHKKTLAVDCDILVIDLDVNKPDEKNDDKYESLDKAVEAAQNANIPTPNMIVCSGHGVHIYYQLEKYIQLEEWSDLANLLSVKARAAGLLCDPATFRPSQPLRVIGTWNKRTGREPVQCLLLSEPRSAAYSVPEFKTKLGMPSEAFDVLDGFDVSTLPPEVLEMDCSADLVSGIDVETPEYTDIVASPLKLYEDCQWFRNEIDTGGMESDYEDWTKFLSVCNTLDESHRDSVAILGSKHHKNYSESGTLDKMNNSGLGGAHKCTSGIPCKFRAKCAYYERACVKVAEPTIAYSGALHSEEEKEANSALNNMHRMITYDGDSAMRTYCITDNGVYGWWVGAIKVQEVDEDGKTSLTSVHVSTPIRISTVPYTVGMLKCQNADDKLMIYNELNSYEKSRKTAATELFYRRLNSCVVEPNLVALPTANGFITPIRAALIAKPTYPNAVDMPQNSFAKLSQGYIMSWVEHYKTGVKNLPSAVASKVLEDATLKIFDGGVDGWAVTDSKEVVYVHGNHVVTTDGSNVDKTPRTLQKEIDSRTGSTFSIQDKGDDANGYVVSGNFDTAYKSYKELFDITNMNMQGMVLMGLASLVRSLQEKVIINSQIPMPVVSIHAPSGSGKTTTIRAVTAVSTAKRRGIFDGANFTESAVYETWGLHPCQLAIIDEISPDVFSKFGTGSYKKSPCHAIAEAIKSLANNSSRKRSLGATGFMADTGERHNTTLIAGNHKLKSFLIDPDTRKYCDAAAACRILEIEDYSITDDGQSADYIDLQHATGRVETNGGQVAVHFAAHLLNTDRTELRELSRKIHGTALMQHINRVCGKLDALISSAQGLKEGHNAHSRFISSWAQTMLITAKLCHESGSLPIAPLSVMGKWIVSIVEKHVNSVSSGLVLMSKSTVPQEVIKEAVFASSRKLKTLTVINTGNMQEKLSSTTYRSTLELDASNLLNDTVPMILKNIHQAEVSAIYCENPDGTTEAAVPVSVVEELMRSRNVSADTSIQELIDTDPAALGISTNARGNAIRKKQFTISLASSSSSKCVMAGDFFFVPDIDLLDDLIGGNMSKGDVEVKLKTLNEELASLKKSVGL